MIFKEFLFSFKSVNSKYEIKILTPNKEDKQVEQESMFVELKGKNIMFENQESYLILFNDITELVKAEQIKA
jgi:nitrogen fixation/metabolism regulation signal transduction histidine kinase